MSGPESLKPDDRLLEEFLAGEGAVRAAYHETASARPPPALDAAILELAASARAPVLMRRAARPRWQLPMATAAVLMLSLGVLLQVQRDPAVQQQLMASPDQATPAASAPAEVVADAALPPVLAVTKPALDEAAVEKKQTAVAAASPKPARPAEKRAPASPPPPPVMAEVLPAAVPAPPQPAATADAPVAEEESLERAAVLGAMAQESMQRRERSAASVAKAQANLAQASALANRCLRRVSRTHATGNGRCAVFVAIGSMPSAASGPAACHRIRNGRHHGRQAAVGSAIRRRSDRLLRTPPVRAKRRALVG